MSDWITPLLKQQQRQIELLCCAAVRCGFNAPSIEQPYNPTEDQPASLLSGTGEELGRWWYANGALHLKATNPEVAAQMSVLSCNGSAH